MTTATKRHSILVPVCPHCQEEVIASRVTPDWSFCPRCRKGPWLLGTLGQKKVFVQDDHEDDPSVVIDDPSLNRERHP